MDHRFHKTYLSLFCMLWITVQVFAQQKYLTVSGVITDSKNGKGIPFAGIKVYGKNEGTSCNAEGRFILKLPVSHKDDSIKISCTGYQSVTKVLSDNGRMDIVLKPAPILLEEVEVRSKRRSAEEILKDAIAAIPKNYDTSAVQLTAFYREDTRLGDYGLEFSEAVIEVYKPPHKEKEADEQIKIIKGRKKEFDHSKDARFYSWLGLGGGAKYAFRSTDMVKLYHEPNKNSMLNAKNFKYYSINLDKILIDGKKSLYVIDMSPGKKSRKAYGRMKLYIDVNTLAFTKLETEMTQAGLDLENNRKFLLKKLGNAIMGANINLSYFKETINFNNYDNKWYLKDVQRDFRAIVNSKKRGIENGLWQTNLIMTVTGINTANPKPFSAGNLYQSERSMSGMINTVDYDAEFWENYNIIQPTRVDSVNNWPKTDTTLSKAKKTDRSGLKKPSNRQNGFTRADTLRGKLTPLRTCYDVSFYHLDVKVDINKKFISGSNLIRFKVAEPFEKMQIDLYANMQIHKISYGNIELPYTREYDAVFIQFPERLKTGTEQAITIYYSGKPKEPDWAIPMDGGFLWQKDKYGNPWVQVVCQGSGASLWWPNKDHQSDKPDSAKISVTVPSGLMDISNGRLIAKTHLPGSWTKYEWKVTYPVNNYNIILNIGKYAHQRDRFINGDTLTLDYYYMPYNEQKAKLLFAGVKPMLTYLEKQYGKYPFHNDGFTLMESLYPMEHQSAVSIGKLPESEITDVNDLPQSLMWHESSHEWWGNSVTSKDIADMWIHEAFAEYSEALMMKAKFGEEGELGYMQSLPERVVGEEPIIGVYDVNHIHYNIEDMYSKGALMLYTFKNVLNNDMLWSNILSGIQKDFKYKTISTSDIVRYINKKTKRDYTYFFDQYLKYSTIPTLNIKLEEKGRDLSVHYKWSADVKDFKMPVKATLVKRKFGFICPDTSWKNILVKNLSKDEFEVDESRFYIYVDQ